MSKADGRVEAGQSIQAAFSAKTWNRFCDTADLVLGRQYGTRGGALGQTGYPANIVLIRNDSGADVGRFGVLGISGVDINPTASAEAAAQFAERPVLTGATPTTASYSEQFCVTIEPIADGAIGRAAVSGVFACKVNVTDADHKYADVKNLDATQLASTSCGVCQLLWKESGTGENKWALGCM